MSISGAVVVIHRNGTIAITSISTSISGQASWLTLRNVCAVSGALPMQVAHLLHRPPIRVTFGSPIPTAELPFGKGTTIDLTRQLQAAMAELRSIADTALSAA